MKQHRLILSLVLAIALLLPCLAGGEGRGNFPVREPDDSTSFYVLYHVLKAGVEPDEEAAFAEYVKLCHDDRKSSAEKKTRLKEKEWSNLRLQAGAYLAHDTYGFKVYVLNMKPGKVTRKTKKVYFTIRNQIEPEERTGLLIVERNKKGRWKLRSLNL